MIVLFFILTLWLCIMPFCVKSEYKLGILLSSIMLLTLVEIPGLGNHAHTLVYISVILSEYRHYGRYLRKIRNRYILAFIVLTVIGGIICLVTSPYLHNVKAMSGFILTEFVFKAFSLVYAYLLTRNAKTLKYTCRLTSYAIMIMTVFGVLNLIMGYSIPVDSLYSGSLDGLNFSVSSRFRVQATFINPFDYGFVCLVCFFVHLHAFVLRQVNKSTTLVCLACCLFGILFCNCRTILFCFLVGGATYLFLSVKITKKFMNNLVFAAIIASLLILVSPMLQKLFLNVFSIFDVNSTVEGSSLSARLVQLLAVLYYIKDDFIFGRGVFFFSKELGWENGAEGAYDHDLLGLEGNYLSLLLERGLVGFLLFIIVVIVLFKALIHYRKYAKRQFALGMTVLVVYLLFGTMTGELLSVAPSYLIIGYSLSSMVIRSKQTVVGHEKVGDSNTGI